MSYIGWRPVDKIFQSNARIISIDTAKCVFSTKEWGGICKGDGTANEFRDRLSKMDYAMSGACQACQDDIAKCAEEEEEMNAGECVGFWIPGVDTSDGNTDTEVEG